MNRTDQFVRSSTAAQQPCACIVHSVVRIPFRFDSHTCANANLVGTAAQELAAKDETEVAGIVDVDEFTATLVDSIGSCASAVELYCAQLRDVVRSFVRSVA